MKPAVPPPERDVAEYRRMWRIVDGAVRDAFRMHPDYLVAKNERSARASIVKRVVGAVVSSAKAEGRSSD